MSKTLSRMKYDKFDASSKKYALEEKIVNILS